MDIQVLAMRNNQMAEYTEHQGIVTTGEFVGGTGTATE